jgi:hypothetical protein
MIHIAADGGKKRLESKIRQMGVEMKVIDHNKDYKRILHMLQSKFFEIQFKINNKKFFLKKLKLLIHQRKLTLRK